MSLRNQYKRISCAQMTTPEIEAAIHPHSESIKSRRWFLGKSSRLLMAGSIAVAVGVPRLLRAEEFHENLDLYHEIGQRGVSVSEINTTGTFYWTRERLQMMLDFRVNLPDFFFENSAKSGRVFTTTLRDLKGSAGRSPGRWDIELDPTYFTPNDRKGAASLIGHELTHSIRPPTREMVTNSQIISMRPGYEEVKRIMGVTDWGTEGIYLHERAKTILNTRQLTAEQRTFLNVFMYGVEPSPYYFRLYGKDRINPEEFIANLGGAYVLGPQYFFEMYHLVLPQDITQELYKFTKYNLFRGRDDYFIPLYELKAG